MGLLRNWRSNVAIKSQSAARIMVHLVVAGLVSDFREVEQTASTLGLGPISVMPVHVEDLLE